MMLSKRNHMSSYCLQSMAVFANTAEFDSRRTLMVSLQNQLEAALSSALVAAITAQDNAQCRQFFTIFSNIQRESEFRNYYNASTRTSLVTMWNEAHIKEGGNEASTEQHKTSSGPVPFASFLPTFYSAFLVVLNQERISIPAIFPDPASTMSTLISSIISSLQPSFSQRLSAVSAYHGPSAIVHLIAAFKATEEFAAATDKIIEKAQYAAIAASPAAPSSPLDSSNPQDLASLKSHHRRRSSRMSMSLRPTSNSAGWQNVATAVGDLDWDQELFQPFLSFQTDYASLEKRFFDTALDVILSSDTSDQSSDRARLLRERAVDVFGTADDSINRCLTFTHGYGALGLIQALDHFLKSFIDIWTADVTSSWSSTSIPLSLDSEEDLSDLDYTAQDWTSIQLSLHLLASTRAFLDRLASFEAKIRSNLVQVSIRFRMAGQDPSGSFVSGTTKGEGLLLVQSTLNSAELHDLLKSVENDPQPRNVASVPLCVNARASISAFAAASQVSLQSTILSPLRKHLSSYPSSMLWIAGPPEQRSARTLDVPTFSLSPSDIAQRLAEGMLNLPRLFEVYAGDEALSFSLETLPFVDAEALKQMSEGNVAPDRSPPSSHMRRPSLAHKPSSQSQAAMGLTPEAISAAWLTSLARSIFFYLTSKVLPSIKTLSIQGAAQLSSDLGYLSNIMSALGAEWPDLEKWRDYVSIEEEEAKQRSQDFDDPIFKQVAEMRGWSAS